MEAFADLREVFALERHVKLGSPAPHGADRLPREETRCVRPDSPSAASCAADLPLQLSLDRCEIDAVHLVKPAADGFQRGNARYRRARACQSALENARHRRNYDARKCRVAAPGPAHGRRHCRRNAISVRSRGSRPRSTVTARTRARHRRIGDRANAVRGPSLQRQTQGLADIVPSQRLRSASDRSRVCRPPAMVALIKPSTTLASVTVRPVIAEAVTGRSRHRAGRLRPDDQKTALVDAGQRAAAGADFGDIDSPALSAYSRRP